MLTKKQSKILSFIKKVYFKQGYIPSVREIAKNLGLSSPATVWGHIQNLIGKGYLKREKDNSLMIVHSVIASAFEAIPLYHAKPEIASSAAFLAMTPNIAIELPLVGSIIAGNPIESWEQRGETFSVPVNLVKDPNSYVLQVRGDSMIEDGILEGDYVIVERNFYPKNGDVVVALLNNSAATLKKFFREKDRIRLQPANSSLPPIYTKDIAIQGIVRAIIRKFA